MADDHLHALPYGHRIDEYEILGVLGAGGFGITYLAYNRDLGGTVALKEYFPYKHASRARNLHVEPSSPESHAVFGCGLDQFMQQAQSIHRLAHPNVVRVDGSITTNGTAYRIMEYIQGKTLAAILNERGVLHSMEWRPWLDSLLRGLAHLHARGYLHRGITPSNIKIRDADGEPVLLDLGSSHFAGQEQIYTREPTPAYAPIEQRTNDAVHGPSTDIYAIAAVSYRVLTGVPPQEASDRVLADRYAPLIRCVPGSNSSWLNQIDHALALHPEDRPPSVWKWGMALADSLNDTQQNASLCRIAAAGSDPDAQVQLGRMYDSGKGVPRDYKQAVKFYRLAARSDCADGQFALGQMYYWGRGTEPDPDLAHAWWRRAANQGHATAQVCLGRLTWLVLRNKDTATAWLRKAAEQEDPAGQFALAEMSSRNEAVTWYRKAADQGHAKAQLALGRAYELGEGVPCDANQAMHWYRKAAELDDAVAQCALGRILWSADREMALAWYRKAADQKFSVAAFITKEEEEWNNRLRMEIPSLDGSGWTPHRGFPITTNYDYGVYKHFVEEHYLSCGESGSDLNKAEDSLLAAIFSVYNQFRGSLCDSWLFDSVFQALCNDDESFGQPGDMDDRDYIERELGDAVCHHIVYAVEHFSEVRYEFQLDDFDLTLAQWRGSVGDLPTRPSPDDIDDRLECIQEAVDDLESSLTSASKILAESSTWLARWAADKYAIDICSRYFRQLNGLHEDRLCAAREEVEAQIAEWHDAIEKLRQ